MINHVIDDLQTIIEASRIQVVSGNPPLQWFHFSRLEDFELHSEIQYPICLAHVRTSSAQIEGTQKGYEIELMCLDKLPERNNTQTDNQFQKEIDDKLEKFKLFIQHVCYFLTHSDYPFLYTLEADLVRFEERIDDTEWGLISVVGNFNVISNTGGFVCELQFDESLFL